METSEERFPFEGTSEIHVRALYVCERIETRTLEKTEFLAYSPLALRVSDESCAVILRYGAVVFFNVLPLDEVDFLDKLKPFMTNPLEVPEQEEINVQIGAGKSFSMKGEVLSLTSFTITHMQLLAEILARSVVLDHYEKRVAADFKAIEPLAVRLKEKGHRGTRSKEVLRHIGEVLTNQHNMVGRVEVSEKPELLWYSPDLERLYAYLEDEFEIRERHRALERKLDLISRTAQTMLNLLQTKRSLRVEWYIVILIVVEILLSVYQLFLKQ
ncbi:MAG: RMD1 family protein [Deltaproteobacteria bacterium]